MNKKISIIMPVYKVMTHITLFKRAIDGIMKQNYKNWELIIICDGGERQNQTVKAICYVLGGYVSKNALILRADKHYGPHILRNIAYNYTKSDYLTFHDSDDYSSSDRLTKLVLGIRDKDDNIIASNIIVNKAPFKKSTKNKKFVKYGGKADLFMTNNKIKPAFHLSSALLTSDLFEEMGGFERCLFAADSLFAIKLNYLRYFCDTRPVPILGDFLFEWNRHKYSITKAGDTSKTFRSLQEKHRSELEKSLDQVQKGGSISENNIKTLLKIKNNFFGAKDISFVRKYNAE